MLNRRSLGIAALGLLSVVVTFLLLILVQLVVGANLRGTILSGGVVGAVVGFAGVLVGQYLAQSRHSEGLVQARDLEAQRAHESALQQYLERVGNLLIEQHLREATPSDNVTIVARAQTLAVLEGLDPTRKRILLQFLYESGLIHSDKPVVSLFGANLEGADLRRANLEGVDLRRANLEGADLRRANLGSAKLKEANLRSAKLMGELIPDTRRGFREKFTNAPC